MPENNLASLITVRADVVSEALSAGGDESRLCLASLHDVFARGVCWAGGEESP